MGYYTLFDGHVSGPAELVNQFVLDADEGKKFGQYSLPLQDWVDEDLIGGDSMKWYQWEEDLTALSKTYPGLLFVLEGRGEESYDIWKAWARNGKLVRVNARIVFDEPDLEVVVPAPDVDSLVESHKQMLREELDAQIAELEARKAAL